MDTFTYRNARDRAITAAIAVVILVETIVLHVALVAGHPVLAWRLTALSLITLAWLVADARAFGRGALRLDHEALHVAVGRRWTGEIPRGVIESAFRPTWRDIPAGQSDARYVNLTKPAEPNVIIVLRSPVPLRMLGALTRQVTRVGLHLDKPDTFVTALWIR